VSRQGVWRDLAQDLIDLGKIRNSRLEIEQALCSLLGRQALLQKQQSSRQVAQTISIDRGRIGSAQ